MSAEKVGATPGHYVMEGTLNGKPFTREFVAIEDYNALQAHYADLLALAKRYASECAECGGSGLLCGACGRALSPYEASGTAEELSCCTTPHRYVCDACADIRAVIKKAEGGA